MPDVYEFKFILPQKFNVPDILIYSYMIHRIAKIYSITKKHAARYTEYDFWLMTGFENLDNMRNEYLLMKEK